MYDKLILGYNSALDRSKLSFQDGTLTIGTQESKRFIFTDNGELTLPSLPMESITGLGNKIKSIEDAISSKGDDITGLTSSLSDLSTSLTSTSNLLNDTRLSMNSLDSTVTSVQTNLLNTNSYVNGSNDILTLGKTDMPMQITIDNDSLNFIDSDIVVAYVQGQKMYVNVMEVLSSAKIGAHLFEKYDDNTTLVRWVG
jgi:hypothetical protein